MQQNLENSEIREGDPRFLNSSKQIVDSRLMGSHPNEPAMNRIGEPSCHISILSHFKIVVYQMYLCQYNLHQYRPPRTSEPGQGDEHEDRFHDLALFVGFGFPDVRSERVSQLYSPAP